MDHDYIEDQQHLDEFCNAIPKNARIAFDTEFISEDSYRPQLCLVQVAAGDRRAIIDPFAVDDLCTFWKLLAEPGRETVVHAGREEFRFCVQAIGKPPQGWFDIQLAAGFVGLEYPAAYGTLISKLLSKALPKGETRTDWRRRPLSRRQLDYALQDVVYLEPIRQILYERMQQLGRLEWFREDTQAWQEQMQDDASRDRWRRVSGISGLSSRSLAIVRELSRWREAEAQRRDCPLRRVLRDDLIVELARRKTADVKQIRAVRGLDRSRRHHPDLAECIQRALDLPSSECPPPNRRNNSNSSQFGLLGQFLNTALGTICRSAQLAPTLVGTVRDVRDLTAHRLGIDASPDASPPALASGWRAEIVGRVIEDLLDGKLALRVSDPFDDLPLRFEALCLETGIQNSESRIQNSESGIQNSESQE